MSRHILEFCFNYLSNIPEQFFGIFLAFKVLKKITTSFCFCFLPAYFGITLYDFAIILRWLIFRYSVCKPDKFLTKHKGKPAMRNILLNIPEIDQYLKAQKEQPETLRPPNCPNCGKEGLWHHGHYDRKTASASSSREPVHIYRFFCPHCHKTCSTLPECISPHRWYLWKIQQMAAALVFAGKSFRTIAKTIAPSRHTISRWMGRLKERFRLHKDALCQHFIDLGGIDNFVGFWLSCFSRISLSQAMCFCNAAGVKIP